MRHPHRPLLLALAILAGPALVACGEDKARDKKVATLEGEGFSVKMPGKPKRQVLTAPSAAGPVRVIAYLTEGGSEGFAMSVATIPSGVKGDLDGAVQGAAANVRGTVKDVGTTTYQGFPARDTRITNARDRRGNKGTVFARVILAKGKLFQLQFVSSGADVKSPPAAYKTFLSSLKIT